MSADSNPIEQIERGLANLEGAASGSSEWRAEYRADIASVREGVAALEERYAAVRHAYAVEAQARGVVERERDAAFDLGRESGVESGLARSEGRVSALEKALAFYADPMTYFGIGIFPDRPCGEFIDDISEVPWPDGGTNFKPGKHARDVLAGVAPPEEQPHE